MKRKPRRIPTLVKAARASRLRTARLLKKAA
ncbi:hypothetical protein HNQ64_001374 [Prosthecobacter dejongeii]|uniref:Uncharacterized protein n=1 Tax=Prosthecobacter dejongeii TaxID=48465 RepID=A0A7W7YJB4_9BACT|nr:hypothetical protein [Prosthecobacter dejongeii]